MKTKTQSKLDKGFDYFVTFLLVLVGVAVVHQAIGLAPVRAADIEFSLTQVDRSPALAK